MTSAIVVVQVKRGPCEERIDLDPFEVLGEFEVSTYTPTEGQVLWNEAFCCPRCGEVWGRVSYHTHDTDRIAWSFTPRECGGLLLSESNLDYLLLKGPSLTPSEMELVIHEYSRCLDLYSGLAARRSTVSGSARIPTVDEL